MVHWQTGLVNQALGKMQPLRVGNGQRRRTKVCCEQTSQMTTCDAKSLGEVLDIAIIERATGDQS
jgi:hypothetical protein